MAAEAGRPEDGSDDEEMTTNDLPPLPRKHSMGLSKRERARAKVSVSLSVSERESEHEREGK